MPDAAHHNRTDGAGLKSLASFAAQIDCKTLPPGITVRARACLLYGLAVGIAALRARAPQIAAAALDFEYGDAAGKSTRFIDRKRVSAGAAAFANGVLMHARVQDDAHPAGHVGVVVIPAALAVAEQLGASGEDLLAALVAGYEVALRIGRDHAADLSSRGFRTTPPSGAFGAAAAAARLMRLDGERTMHALALAANTAGGLREFSNAGSGEYPFHAGFTARNGISAASCAQSRAEAAATSLEGAAGFYRAFGEQGKDYGRRLSERLGEEFALPGITYKPYPVCQFHRSVIRGVLELRKRAPDNELRAMVIRMNPFEADFFGVRYAGPYKTFSQAFMSAQFCAALAWSAGDVTYQGLHEFEDANVLREIPRIEVVSDPARQRYQPHIAVHCADGAARLWEETAGEDAFSLTWDAAVQMSGILCGEVGVPQAAAADLIRAANLVAEAPDVTDVIGAVCAAINGIQ